MVLDIFTTNIRECRLLAWRGRYRILFSQKYKDGPASLELVEVWRGCFNRRQGTESISRTSRHLLKRRNQGGLLPTKTKSEEIKAQSSAEVPAPLDFRIFRYLDSGIIW